MPQAFDLALLDERLESLLELTASARAARLDALEQTEPELAATMRRLLSIAASVQTSEIREAGGAVRIVSDEAPAPAIAGYRITGEIGRGGMATVYAATRDVHGVAQSVAIKLLRTAILHPLERERFLNEQRILARLKHPNVATLLEVGTVDDRPYMVMERIEGRPIDARPKPGAADLPGILEAIDQVAAAVELAHQHFIIHRDIKPDNVLIDAQGRIKLIDFGIAKILDESGGLRADPTLTGSAPLTLRYASPEQLLNKPVGVGSDIYQLGLLLYTLATGAWPYDDASEFQVGRVRPDVLPVPASRRVDDPALRRALQGDLDSIVLKCLAFDPAQRYRSVAELRADLERYREHRPVSARRHTRGYVLKAFVLRHRLGVAVATSAALLLVVGAVAALGLAASSRQYAARTAKTLDAMTELFSPANPYAPSPKTTTVSEAVDRAAEKFLIEDTGDPDFQARMLLRLADMQEASENYAGMRKLLERADELSRDNPDKALRSHIVECEMEALFRLGAYEDMAKLARERGAELEPTDRLQAEHLAASVLTEQGKLPEALAALHGLVPRMQPLGAVEQSQILNSLAIAQGRSHDYESEFATYQKALALLDPKQLAHLPMLIRMRANSATALGNLKRPDEAAEQYLALLPKVRDQLGIAHPMVAKVSANTTIALLGAERFDDAFNVTGDLDHANVLKGEPAWRAQYLTIRAGAALYDGHFDVVLPSLLEAAQVATATLGKGSPRLAYYAEQLAWSLWEFGERDLALAAADDAFRLSEGKRTVADMLLQLGGESGLPIANRPDPQFLARMESDCDKAHYRALHAKLVEKRDPPREPVPVDCASYERARLETLGFAVEPPRKAAVQPMRSPLTLRWRSPDDPALASLDQAIDATLRQQLAAAIDGF